MKWGVRHDKQSIGQRYSTWARGVANKNYDKASARIEKRRQKRANENFLRNTKYGKWVDTISNKHYDKQQKSISERRTRKNKDFDDFDKMIDPKEKRRRAEKRKTNISKMRNYTGSNKSDALKRARRKDINKMSNADLQKTINRLNLEKQYRDLTKVNLTPGKRYVDSYKDYNKSINQARKAASTVAIKKAMTTAVV